MGEAIAPLKQLRNCFERVNKRLESLPECGLSEAGQPYIQEVADALQSFAAWFGELTFDEYSITGLARSVHVALAAGDAIVDWVGLHRSQQFARDISGQMAELVEQSQALDDAVMAAFLVERSPNRVVYRTTVSVPQEKRDAVEDGIEAVASLANHLGIRLQRIALMTRSPVIADSAAASLVSPSLAREKRKSRKGIGGAKRKGSPVNELHTLRAKYEARCRRLKKTPDSLKQWLCDWGTANGMLYADADLTWKRERARMKRAGKQ